MQHLGEVDWSLVESALENEHANLELDSLLHGKPVKSVSYVVYMFQPGVFRYPWIHLIINMWPACPSRDSRVRCRFQIRLILFNEQQAIYYFDMHHMIYHWKMLNSSLQVVRFMTINECISLILVLCL